MTEFKIVEPDYITLTSKLVAAYVGRNAVKADGLSALISSVHEALRATRSEPATISKETQAPAVKIGKSISPNNIICLECGLHFQSMKRHLMSSHSLSVNDYKTKWKLPDDYPITAPAYSERRSTLAKGFGLGLIGGRLSSTKTAGRRL